MRRRGPAPADDRLAAARVVLVMREGCHLCEVAQSVVEAVVAETGDTFATVDIDQHPDLAARHSDEVPVTFVDGRQHDFWRVDPVRLRKALAR